eukprot:gene4086-8125_t
MRSLIVKDQALREEFARTAALEREIRDLRHELHVAKTSPRAPSGVLVSPRLNIRISKLQAAVRGYVHRARLHRVRVHHAALSAGVLFAMKNTEQGETGWYCAPDGSLYYFVLEEGEYLMACGPLTMAEYETVMDLSLDRSSKSKGMNTVAASKLIKCDLKLANGIDEDTDAQIYIASRSQKLYMALPLDGRIFPTGDSTIGDSARSPRSFRSRDS